MSNYKQTEVGLIPEDWNVKLLSTLAEKITVGIASAATHAYRDKGIVLLRNQNIKSNYLDDKDVLFITEEYEQLFKGKRLKKGDLLTARTGYPGTTCIVPLEHEGSQSFTTLITRPKPLSIENKFLCYYLNSEKGQSFFEANQIGGGQKNVNAGTLKLMPIPIPPTIQEQTAIATALSDTDALITSLEKLIAKKRNIKQVAMQELLRPKEGWEVKKLGVFCISISSGKSNTKSNNGIFPIYGSTGIIGWNETYDYEGTKILVARVGANAGRVNIVNHKYCVSDNTLIINYNPIIVDTYFLFYNLIKIKLNNLVFGSGQPLITGGQLKNLEIPLPQLATQKETSKILFEMDSEISALETKLSKYKQIKQGMMQNLLTGKIRLV